MPLVVFMYCILGDGVCAFQVLHMHGGNYFGMTKCLGLAGAATECRSLSSYQRFFQYTLVHDFGFGHRIFPVPPSGYDFSSLPIPNLWHQTKRPGANAFRKPGMRCVLVEYPRTGHRQNRAEPFAPGLICSICRMPFACCQHRLSSTC